MTAESNLRDALASQFDQYAVRGCLRDGDRNTVYEVSVDGRRAVCKTTGSRPGMLAREGAVLDAISERTSIPVPDVLADGEGYLVLEWASGDTYDSDDSLDCRRARLRAVGHSLARLHRITADWFEGHGALERGGGPLTVARPTDWSDRLLTFVDEWASDLAGTRDADVGSAVAEFVAEHRHAFADCSPVLVHGEPAPDHVRFEDDEAVALLDWEIAQAAPGEFDLVWAERDFLGFASGRGTGGELRAALHEGYESERPSTLASAFRREVYRAAFAMRDLTLLNDGTDGDGRRAVLRAYVFDRLDAAEATEFASGQ